MKSRKVWAIVGLFVAALLLPLPMTILSIELGMDVIGLFIGLTLGVLCIVVSSTSKVFKVAILLLYIPLMSYVQFIAGVLYVCDRFGRCL